MNALWYPAAVRYPGPENKTSGLRSPSIVKQAVYHSAEGNWAALMAQLDNRGNVVSWHLSNPVHGPLVQHYGLNVKLRHARFYNTPTIGVENEGVAGVPLSRNQSQNLQTFSRWLVGEGWLPRLTRPSVAVRVADATLLEHTEVGQYLADPPYGTACPSDRIPWDYILEAPEEQDDMVQQAQIDGLMTIVAGLGEITKSQQAQIDYLISVAVGSAHTHGEADREPLKSMADLEALAEGNRRRLEALGAAATG